MKPVYLKYGLCFLLALNACQSSSSKNHPDWQSIRSEPKILASLIDQRHSVYFATNDSKLSEAELRSLGVFASSIGKSATVRIKIDGHADMRGSKIYNQDLSVRRAKAVGEALKSLGIKQLDFELSGFGEQDPAAFGRDLESLALNRRVELIAEIVAVDLQSCSMSDVDLSKDRINESDPVFGCANLANLIDMAADSRDFLSTKSIGKSDIGQSDPTGQFELIERYRKREIPELPSDGGS